MSEHLKHSGEHKVESLDLSAESQKNLERIRSNESLGSKEATAEQIKNLEAAVKSESISGKEISIDTGSESSASPIGLHRELKNTSYKQTMKRVQSQLPAVERVFSKVIHKPVVEKVSNAAGQTIGRPSGVLGGGLFALAGSAILLYMSRHYGFKYNYLVFSMLFVGGFVAGLIIEMITRFVAKRRTA